MWGEPKSIVNQQRAEKIETYNQSILVFFVNDPWTINCRRIWRFFEGFSQLTSFHLSFLRFCRLLFVFLITSHCDYFGILPLLSLWHRKSVKSLEITQNVCCLPVLRFWDVFFATTDDINSLEHFSKPQEFRHAIFFFKYSSYKKCKVNFPCNLKCKFFP